MKKRTACQVAAAFLIAFLCMGAQGTYQYKDNLANVFNIQLFPCGSATCTSMILQDTGGNPFFVATNPGYFVATGSSAFNVTVQNTPNVSVTNSPTVTMSNLAVSVVNAPTVTMSNLAVAAQGQVASGLSTTEFPVVIAGVNGKVTAQTISVDSTGNVGVNVQNSPTVTMSNLAVSVVNAPTVTMANLAVSQATSPWNVNVTTGVAINATITNTPIQVQGQVASGGAFVNNGLPFMGVNPANNHQQFISVDGTGNQNVNVVNAPTVTMASLAVSVTNSPTVTMGTVVVTGSTSIQTGSNIVGYVSADPCMQSAKLATPINSGGSAATVQLVGTGASSKNIYVCGIMIVVAVPANVNLVEGTGSFCQTGSGALIGSTVATQGVPVATQGGFVEQGGSMTVAKTATSADNICVVVSTASQWSGNISYVQQ